MIALRNQLRSTPPPAGSDGLQEAPSLDGVSVPDNGLHGRSGGLRVMGIALRHPRGRVGDGVAGTV